PLGYAVDAIAGDRLEGLRDVAGGPVDLDALDGGRGTDPDRLAQRAGTEAAPAGHPAMDRAPLPRVDQVEADVGADGGAVRPGAGELQGDPVAPKPGVAVVDVG